VGKSTGSQDRYLKFPVLGEMKRDAKTDIIGTYTNTSTPHQTKKVKGGLEMFAAWRAA